LLGFKVKLKAYIFIFAISFIIPQSSFAENIDNMWCQPANGFNERMTSQGFQRESTFYFGWGEYDESVSHNISGSDVDSYDKKAKNRRALYTSKNGAWKIFQGITRQNLNTKKTEHFVCEVKSGSKFTRH